jgi:hypothetical protein
MRDIIAESIGKSDRRSSRKLEPSADDVLTYRYMPTPGS